MPSRYTYNYLVVNKVGEMILVSNYQAAMGEMKQHGLTGEPTRLIVYNRIGDAKFSRGVPITKAAKEARPRA